MVVQPHWPLFQFQKDITVKGYNIDFFCKLFLDAIASLDLGYESE